MQKLTLSDIIGSTIESIRYHYLAQNEYGLQEFHSYLKLSNGIIINIPVYDDEVFFMMNEGNTKFFRENFNKGENLSSFGQHKTALQQIEDIYFCYYQGEIDDEKRAYLKLGNGYYLTEINYAHIGVHVDLLILNEQEFLNRIHNLSENVKSYLTEIRNSR